MNKAMSSSSDAHALRRQAEQKLRTGKGAPVKALAETDVRAMVHELQVHQIELEMQNDELQLAQAAARKLADKYAELFDFAPSGYFVLDSRGAVREVNLAGAALLGVERHRIVGQPFEPYVAPDSREAFTTFCRGVRLSEEGHSCEMRLLRCDLSPCDVLVTGVGAEGGPGEGRNCRLILRDITERRQIENALRFLAQFDKTAFGGDFFKALAHYLAQSLGMDFVCIDRLLGGLLTAQALAHYSDGKWDDNMSYTLKDTPCANVVEGRICCFPRDVRRQFPGDGVLQRMAAESYVGTILWSSRQQPIGLIALIGRRPLAHPELAQTILQLVAVHAASELERRDVEEALRASHTELTSFNRAMVHRELRMIELKKQMNDLCAKAGLPPAHKMEEEGKSLAAGRGVIGAEAARH